MGSILDVLYDMVSKVENLDDDHLMTMEEARAIETLCEHGVDVISAFGVVSNSPRFTEPKKASAFPSVIDLRH